MNAADRASAKALGIGLFFRRFEQPTRQVAHPVHNAYDIQGIPTNTVKNEMLVEWLSHEEKPYPGELGMSVIRLFSNPRIPSEQPCRDFDGIGESLCQSDAFLSRIVICLQGDVSEGL